VNLRDALSKGSYLRDQVDWEIIKADMMSLRNNLYMTKPNRRNIKEGDNAVVLIDSVGRDGASRY